MKIVKDKISISELKELMEKGFFVDVVKAVVDIEKEIMAVDAEMHADLLDLLMEQENSAPPNVWGINLYPQLSEDQFIVFTSLINIKPSLGNKSTEIGDKNLQEKIRSIIKKLVLP